MPDGQTLEDFESDKDPADEELEAEFDQAFEQNYVAEAMMDEPFRGPDDEIITVSNDDVRGDAEEDEMMARFEADFNDAILLYTPCFR